MKNYDLFNSNNIIHIWGSAEKFIGWWYSHRMYPNEVYFSALSTLWFAHFFHQCCSAWILLVKKVLKCCYDVVIWTFQPTQVLEVKYWKLIYEAFLSELGKSLCSFGIKLMEFSCWIGIVPSLMPAKTSFKIQCKNKKNFLKIKKR